MASSGGIILLLGLVYVHSVRLHVKKDGNDPTLLDAELETNYEKPTAFPSLLEVGQTSASQTAMALNDVTIQILEASDLTAADFRLLGKNTSDPYVIVKDVKGLKPAPGQPNEACETSTKFKTLNPVWKEECVFQFNHKLSAFKFKVVDEDDGLIDNKDDKLGKAQVSITDFFGKAPVGQPYTLDKWLPLEKPNKGHLHVRITVVFRIPIVMPGQYVRLPDRFSIGLAWDFKKKEAPIDLDASVIGLDVHERKTDQVWWKHLTGFGGAVRHSGDNRTGDGDGDDEVITIDTTRLRSYNTEKLAVVINSFTQQYLTKVKYAYIRVFEGSGRSEKTLAFYALGKGRVPKCIGLFFGAVQEYPGKGWIFRTVNAQANGRTAPESLPAVVEYGKANLGW